MPLTQLFTSVKDGVVQVLALSGSTVVSSGSGSVIGDDRTVLTCAHCVVAGMTMAVADPAASGRAILGSIAFIDATTDIAVLEFPRSVGSPVSFGNSAGCAIGNGAFVVGFPMGVQELTLLSAHIAGFAGAYLRLDSSVNHGNSGGPLFDLNGHQIGVINAKHGSLSDFLERIKTAQPGVTMSVGGIDPVKAIQVLIQEMERNLNLGMGYAIPTSVIKPLHPKLNACIP
jgi:S1-C subfamily serine protease